MAKSSKLTLFIFSLLLVLSSILFVACGKSKYADTYISTNQEFVEMFAGKEAEVSVTINNPEKGMSNGILCSISNPNVAQVERKASQSFTTTFKVLGKNGGTTNLEFASVEGGKKTEITIYVKEFSDILEEGLEKLYVTPSKILTPTSSNFVFNDNATERNLSYYFYGIDEEEDELTVDDIKESNQFQEIQLKSINSKNYLIFKNKDGLFYTLGNEQNVQDSNNKTFNLTEIAQNDGEFVIDASKATAVNPGQKFTFIAKYLKEKEEEEEPDIICKRDFSILLDIDKSAISHEYGYKILNEHNIEIPYQKGVENTSYKIEDYKNGDIILIPSYKTPIADNVMLAGCYAKYLTAYLEVTLATENANLLIDAKSRNVNISSAMSLGSIKTNEKTTYYYEINCSLGETDVTYFDITFYYDGFKDSEDDSVSYTYSIPVVIREIPTQLLINDADFNTTSRVFKFYNSYASFDAGWYPFNFSVLPEGSNFTKLTMNLTNTGLQARYMNKVYTEIVEINNLRETVYLKGVDGATITSDVKEIPVKLEFNVIRPDAYETTIKYEIVKGASKLEFATEEFANNVYLQYEGGSKPFIDIFADAEFENVTSTLESGIDVINIGYNGASVYEFRDNLYYLNLNLIPKNIGSGTYRLAIDNGRSVFLNITVNENLTIVNVSSNNENKTLRLFESTGIDSSTAYLYNMNGESYFDVQLYANNNMNSNAIRNVLVSLNSSSITWEQDPNVDNRFKIYSKVNGTTQITFTVSGYKIDAFAREDITIKYIIKLITFDYIEELNVYKLKDGFSQGDYAPYTKASYVDLYSNTYSQSLREVKFEVDCAKEGYLFENPENNFFEDENYSNEYLYFESRTQIYQQGKSVSKIYYDSRNPQNNIYTIGNYGTFDAENLTFTAFQNLLTTGKIILFAHVRQFNKLYSFSINITIHTYEEVSRISLQTMEDRVTFSVLESEKSIIAFPTNSTATNPKIVAIPSEATAGERRYNVFDDSSITYLESGGKTQISFKLNDEFIRQASNETKTITGTILIAAQDWLDDSGVIRSDYRENVISLRFEYENGTEGNRFTIRNADDLLAMRDNLSAHYKISTNIDVAAISNQFPLGELKGSIIGVNEYAQLSNIIISHGVDDGEGITNLYGVFSKIAKGAFIEYVQFSGVFIIGSNDNPKTARIGMVAGQNDGKLINVGVSINRSNIYIQTISEFGGLVGVNNGEIIQDFTLFEDEETSQTKTKVAEEEGRISYKNFNPKITVLMNDFVNVYYVADQDISIGGVVGQNNGTIQKIDSSVLKFSGYTNYMVYSRLKTQYISIVGAALQRVYVGALVGDSTSRDAKIQSGYNKSTGFTVYNSYGKNESNFSAGKGLIVGGEVWGYGYIGGAVGKFFGLDDSEDKKNSFTGLTVRTFVRGQQANDAIASLALIANINEEASLYRTFAIQAVDDGRVNDESAMAVLYSSDANTQYFDNSNALRINKLGFGTTSNTNLGTLVLKGSATTEINVYSYINSRDYLHGDNIIINNSSKDVYYGNFIIVGISNSNKRVLKQATFEPGNQKDLSVSQKFNNKLISSDGSQNVFYAYYYQVASSPTNDIVTLQEELDKTLNRVTMLSPWYPFVVEGELTFTSLTPSILSIDPTGTITFKRTGLAKISATSVLNTNSNSTIFYIYVVNYFNSQSLIKDNSKRDSIIYPSLGGNAVPFNNTIIELRGNNNYSVYVKPDYTFTDSTEENGNFNVDKSGVASIKGVIFNLAANNSVTAKVEINEEATIEKNSDTEIEKVDEKELSITIIDQNITFRRTNDTREIVYALNITPILKVNLGNGDADYIANVNKALKETAVDYKYGAISLNNINYNSVPIQTSKTVNDELEIMSTDAEEDIPFYKILGLEGEDLQGNITNCEYAISDQANYLFKVSITRLTGNLTKDDLINGLYKITYKMVVSVNTNSSVYIERYNQNIYGRYILYLQSASNSDVTLTIPIDFEKTNVTAVIIDNYTSVREINESMSLGASSEYAYPGESGMLEITINPEDSDFDYIIIENDSQNYTLGRASAQFSLLARYADNNKKMFNDGVVSGHQLGTGFRIELSELVEAYNKKSGDEEDKNLYNPYNGVIYIRYDISSQNVSDLSISRFNVLIYKDGAVVHTASIDLTVKIQNFVAVEIEGKDGVTEGNYYRVYNVARGLKYKLKLESYGFNKDNITLVSSNNQLGQISYENGSYYLTITGNSINYVDGSQFEIITTASQTDSGVIRNAESRTKICIQEFVLNYNGENVKNPDIVKGMSNGIINIQVGSYYNLEIDIYDYLEYDTNNQSVVNKVEEFINELETMGMWRVFTNLISTEQPSYNVATEEIDEDLKALSPYIGYSNNILLSGENYYLNYNGLRIQPKRTHLPEEKFYFIKYNVNFTFENGTYSVYSRETGPESPDIKSNNISTIIILNVYSTSSEESPIPIYDYDDFTNMMAGGYYILLNDINLPNAYDAERGEEQFMPIAGNFASFDGNGHSINFSGEYNMGNLSSIGIFSSVEDGATVKNLIVNYLPSEQGNDLNTQPNDIYELNGLRTVKFITTSDSFIFGSVTAENYGIITNCSVFTAKTSDGNYYLTIKADNALNGNSYVGGVAGTNLGFITNCSVSMNAKVPFNLAGVVARNNKKVAACYFKEGNLINNSHYNQHVSGFAITNSSQAQIITSYVAGAQSTESLYSTDENSNIISSLPGAGFIYQNEGLIKDCYSDINLSASSGSMSGFCHANASIIRNCFSLSILRSKTTASAGFVRDNFIEDIYGEFENCFYLSENASKENGDKDINIDLYNVNYEGVEKLKSENFAEIGNYFEDFSYNEQISTNAVWFYSQGKNNGDFVDFIPSTEKVIIKTDDENVKHGSSQSNTIFRTELITFAKNRLELVAPNVKALSLRNFSYSEVDEGTGNITYFYLDDVSAPNRGTKHNPRLIDDYQSMESEILNETASNGLNTGAYRMVSDVSYLEAESYSALNKVIFAGSLEGNGMEIQAISLASMDQLTNGGLFAQIGFSANREGVVKNLSILPREVKFNNAVNVGTLAGTLKFGYIYDITVNGSQNNLTAVSGLNFVGGIIGRAVSKFEIKDIYSDSNIWSIYSPDNNSQSYIENAGNEDKFSYAGGLIGYIGSGVVKNAHINTLTSISGAMAGLAYGGIGSGGRVDKTYADVYDGLQIKAKYYGGLIAGENSGKLNYSHVSDNNNIESIFTSIPKAATAVGGITGLFSGGYISNAVMEQSFRVVNSEKESPIKNIGGLVGLVSSANEISTLDRCIVNGDIVGSTILGGAVGTVSSSLVAKEVAIKSSSLSIVGNNTNPCLGGIIGNVTYDSHASVDLSQSYCWADLSIDSNVAGLETTAGVGGLIGSIPSNRPLNLSYCYTTSSITAKIYDTRAVGSVNDFAVAKAENQEVDYNYNIKSQDVDNVKINEVYFYGHSQSYPEPDSVDLNKYTSNFKPYASFETKAKNHKISLSVNNFGKSSWEYASQDEKSFEKTIFNNLYGNKYQIFDYGEFDFKEVKQDSNGYSGISGVYEIDAFYDIVTRQTSYNLLRTEDKKIVRTLFKLKPGTMNTYTASTKIDETKKNEGSRPVKHESKLLYSNYDVEIGKSNIIKPLTTSIDRKYILTSNNGDNESQKEYDFKYVHDFSGTIQNNQFVECAGGGNAINEGEFKLGTADADQTLTMVESFEISSLVKKEVYRDAEGNYYISIICVNIGISSATDEKQNTYNYLSIEDPNEITTPKYKNLTNGEILNELNINPIRVWVSSGEKLSTLYFEDNIDWLNKM